MILFNLTHHHPFARYESCASTRLLDMWYMLLPLSNRESTKLINPNMQVDAAVDPGETWSRLSTLPHAISERCQDKT